MGLPVGRFSAATDWLLPVCHKDTNLASRSQPFGGKNRLQQLQPPRKPPTLVCDTKDPGTVTKLQYSNKLKQEKSHLWYPALRPSPFFPTQVRTGFNSPRSLIRVKIKPHFSSRLTETVFRPAEYEFPLGSEEPLKSRIL